MRIEDRLPPARNAGGVGTNRPPGWTALIVLPDIGPIEWDGRDAAVDTAGIRRLRWNY